MRFASAEEIISCFEKKGYSFYKFSIFTEGKYLPSDADWNYADLPHVKFVHEDIDTDWSVIGDNFFVVLGFQKFFGLTLPLTITQYSPKPYSQIYHAIIFCFPLVISTTAKEFKPGWTRVTTEYNIGSIKFLSFVRPFIAYLLKKNYKVANLGDFPMRERRGQLRSWGFSFKGDGESHSCKESLNLNCENVIFPEENNDNFPVELHIQKILPSDGEYLHGRDDHLGLQIVRSGGVVSVYPRLCSHEGASLDADSFEKVCVHKKRKVHSSDQKGYKIMCPWHGLLFDPIVMFDLSSQETQKAETDHLLFSIEADILLIDKKAN